MFLTLTLTLLTLTPNPNHNPNSSTLTLNPNHNPNPNPNINPNPNPDPNFWTGTCVEKTNSQAVHRPRDGVAAAASATVERHTTACFPSRTEWPDHDTGLVRTPRLPTGAIPTRRANVTRHHAPEGRITSRPLTRGWRPDTGFGVAPGSHLLCENEVN